ncbi:MAG: hypothetical protein KGN02_03005 [bacterium]|nr:hypothetical protein [bacterium]
MIRRFISSFVALVAIATSMTFAAEKLSPMPQGAEAAFVAGIQKDLTARFATPSDAEKAGFFRYTNEDPTGAISYANLAWNSSDPAHPCQLWYSASGKLLGADFCELKSTSPKRPALWGVTPARWDDFDPHVHYVYTDASGAMVYGKATSVKKYTGAGGDITAPTAAPLVKLGLVKDASQVKHVFLSPDMWDLIVWVLPNPNGAFADKNPNVTPSKSAEKSTM